MNGGPTISEIQKEVRNIFTAVKGLDSAWGFGSFFRGVPFSDIDLLFVTTSSNTDTLSTYYSIVRRLSTFENARSVDFHVVLLTFDEFRSRPLREMTTLFPLTSSQEFR